MLHQVEFYAFKPVVQLIRILAKRSVCIQSIVTRSFGNVAKKPLKMSQTMPMAMPMSMSMYPNNQQSGSLACCLSQANTSPLACSILVLCKHTDSIIPSCKRSQMQKSSTIYQSGTIMDSYNQQCYQPSYKQNHQAEQKQQKLSEQQQQMEELEKLSRVVRKTENFPFNKPLEEKPRQPEITPETPTVPATRPMHNPLSRRHTVDRARLQYINEMFKELANEIELRKPKTKKFVSRSSLHSGRNDKIH